ncbi:trophoblast glycoprotein [Microcaecilia unicolor]|uniref:Trophoblast glycoprotein n=1 Tax=Microcaecilia unicolor TaxID=1415580 RepID=A0A6P7XHG2_9AMPH|nr:trophoblast glycoprotein [Microcaecilia unicolor]
MFSLQPAAAGCGRESRLEQRRSSPKGGRTAAAVGTLWLLLAAHLPGSVCPQPESTPPPPAVCPPACECSKGARTVKCVNANLTEVPRELPLYVRSLFITGNSIASLPAGAFPKALRELSALNLSGNGVTSVESEAFAQLPALRLLDLSRNNISYFSPDAFGASSPLTELVLSNSHYNASVVSQVGQALAGGALGNLTHLDLARNQLLYLPEDAFGALPALLHLDLRDNSLLALRAGVFRHLPRLRSLDLSDNALRRLRDGTLRDLHPPQLALNLANNSWLCDCQLNDLLDWLRGNGSALAGRDELLCWDPESLRGRRLVDLPDSLLVCSEPDDLSGLQTSYVFLGIVLALIGVIFLLVLYLNRKGIKKWMHNIRDACRDHMEGYHYRYEITADPRLTHVSSTSDV